MGTLGCQDKITDKEAAPLNLLELLELIFTNVAFGTHLPTIFEGCVVGFDPYPNWESHIMIVASPKMTEDMLTLKDPSGGSRDDAAGMPRLTCWFYNHVMVGGNRLHAYLRKTGHLDFDPRVRHRFLHGTGDYHVCTQKIDGVAIQGIWYSHECWVVVKMKCSTLTTLSLLKLARLVYYSLAVVLGMASTVSGILSMLSIPSCVRYIPYMLG